MGRVKAWYMWELAHARVPDLSLLAASVNGHGTASPQTKPPQPPKPKPKPKPAAAASQTPPPPQPPPRQPAGEGSTEPPKRSPISEEELQELRTLAALGEMKAFTRAAERLAVKLAIQIIQEDGGAVSLTALTADIAYALDISTQTAKRYIHKHSSRWGELVLDGDFVRLRR